MYYPIGWHKVLNLDTSCDEGECNILLVQANQERELFFILTSKSIHVWHARPAAEVVCHRRSRESIDTIGLNRTAVWKTDSSVIVVATDRDQLLFYQVRRRTSPSSNFLITSTNEADGVYRLKNDPKNTKKLLNGKAPQGLSEQTYIPALTIYSFGKLDLSSVGVSCLMSAEEELIVGSRNGEIYGIQWDGNVDEKFPWSLSKEVKARQDFLVDIKFSSVLSGFALVFNSGRIGFMPLNADQERLTNGDSNSKSCDTKISYLSNVSNATCAEVNHRHRLVAFGLRDSKLIVCNIGDSNTSLSIDHTLDLAACKSAYGALQLGKIECMRYSPDNFALAVVWESHELALWSVFGSLLFCSQQWLSDSTTNSAIRSSSIFNLAWGREGYNLWLCVDDDFDNESKSEQVRLNGQSKQDKTGSHSNSVMIMSLARCNLSTSPHQTCTSDSIILVSEERIYIGPSVPHEDNFDHWITVSIPSDYLNSQHPIRYASIDRECKNLAVAGNKGLGYYSIENNIWSFFSTRADEQCFTVCGDLLWWQDYLIASCYNFNNESFELRAYRTFDNLSNEHSLVQHIQNEIIRMSIFENRLLVLYSDGSLGMFMLNLRQRPIAKRTKSTQLVRSNSIVSENGALDRRNHQDDIRHERSSSIVSWNHSLKNPVLLDKNLILQISPIENLIISNLKANPFCISSIALTRLHFKNHRNDDSILLNACGKLFLLERELPLDLSSSSPTSDMSTTELKDLSIDSHRSHKLINIAKTHSNSIHYASASLESTTISEQEGLLSDVTFKAVSVIATNVEQFWISPEISIASDMSYFKKSLWLSCGGLSSKLQVWLPLLNDMNDPPTGLYVPDRIMLPIKCDIYPLAIRSSATDISKPDDAIVLGAECDVLYRDCKLFAKIPYMNIKRQCRVYLHRILRELLLSQHLGYYAKKIAESCQSLPYFAHCFELLLHEVLEEESTSPVPLPDPMLPQVVKFIKEFPVYLETVVHCARKSELSMWSHLFDERAVGNPRRLFQECLEQQKYDTAASCLLILQSLDKNIISSRMVKELIRLVDASDKYNYLVEELENFLARADLDDRTLSESPASSSTTPLKD